MIKQLIILNIIFLLFCNFGCNKTFTENCMTDRYYSSSFHKYNNGYRYTQREISTNFSEEDFNQLFKESNLSCKEILTKYFYCNMCFNSAQEHIISYNGNKIILDSTNSVIDFTENILSIIANMDTGAQEYDDFNNINP